MPVPARCTRHPDTARTTTSSAAATSCEVYNPVGGDGCFLPDTELFAGEHVFTANAHVIEVLKGKGTLVHEEMLRHSYPHCWRHKTPIIFRATPQWFISMEQSDLRMAALAAIRAGALVAGVGQGAHRGHGGQPA